MLDGLATPLLTILRSIICGTHIEMQPATLWRQIRLLARREAAFQQLHVPSFQDVLATQVRHGLVSFNWLERGGKWCHELHAQGFRIAEVFDDGLWHHVSHFLRESWRRSLYFALGNSVRHELVNEGLLHGTVTALLSYDAGQRPQA